MVRDIILAEVGMTIYKCKDLPDMVCQSLDDCSDEIITSCIGMRDKYTPEVVLGSLINAVSFFSAAWINEESLDGFIEDINMTVKNNVKICKKIQKGYEGN